MDFSWANGLTQRQIADLLLDENDGVFECGAGGYAAADAAACIVEHLAASDAKYQTLDYLGERVNEAVNFLSRWKNSFRPRLEAPAGDVMAEIAAMKAAVNETERREQEERKRIKDALGRGEAVRNGLVTRLRMLEGLPLKGGYVVKVEYDNKPDPKKGVWGVWLSRVQGYESGRLIRFEVDCDFERAWVLHDDIEVTSDCALHLATAVVRANLKV